jgi:hypothetical protein
MVMSDQPWDDGSGEFAAFAELDMLGPYGVTSAELPVISPEQQRAWERAEEQARYTRWQQEQQLRHKVHDKLDKLYHQRVLNAPSYDLLQAEMNIGHLPDVYYDADYGSWWIWSDRERRRYSLAGWAWHAQQFLAVADPERQTATYLTPPLMPPLTPAPSTVPLFPGQRSPTGQPWHPALNSRLTPQVTPAAPTAQALSHQRFTEIATEIERQLDRLFDVRKDGSR